MYTTKISFIHSSPILLRKYVLIIFMEENTLSTDAVATGRISVNSIKRYTKGKDLSLAVETKIFGPIN